MLWRLSQERRIRAWLRKQLPLLSEQGRELGFVHCLLDTDLHRSKVVAAPLRGVLMRTGDQLRFLGVQRPGDVPKVLSWNVSDARCSMLRISPEAFLLPDLVVLSSAAAPVFFFSCGRLGRPARHATAQLHDTLQADLQAGPLGPRRDLVGVGMGMGLLLLLLALVATVLVAAGQRLQVLGPQLLLKDVDGQVWLSTQTELLQLNSSGVLQETYSWEQLGVRRGLSALAMHRDGRLLVADSAEAVVKACELRSRSCEALPAFNDQGLRLRGSASLAIDTGSGAIYLSDAAEHRLLRLRPFG